MEKLIIEIKITDQQGKFVKSNIDYDGYIETKRIHDISLVEDVVKSLVEEIKKLKK